MRKLSGAFDGTVEGFVGRQLDLVCRQIESAGITSAEVHSGLDQARGIELLSDLLDLPSADSKLH